MPLWHELKGLNCYARRDHHGRRRDRALILDVWPRRHRRPFQVAIVHSGQAAAAARAEPEPGRGRPPPVAPACCAPVASGVSRAARKGWRGAGDHPGSWQVGIAAGTERRYGTETAYSARPVSDGPDAGRRAVRRRG